MIQTVLAYKNSSFALHENDNNKWFVHYKKDGLYLRMEFQGFVFFCNHVIVVAKFLSCVSNFFHIVDISNV